jgi:putative hydrolase of the HAD superfamily
VPPLPRAVFFDLDDTLLDDRTATRTAVASFQSRFREFDGETPEAFAARWIAASDRHFARFTTGEIGFLEQRRCRLADVLGRHVDQDEAQRLFVAYLERYEAAWRGFDDALPTIAAIRRRWPSTRLGILTNGDEAQQRQKVARLGLAPLIDALVTPSCAGGRGKPHAAIFAAAAAAVGARPGECLMVGDHLRNDVQAAREAGWEAVWLDRHGAATPAGGPSCRIITRLDALLDDDRS